MEGLMASAAFVAEDGLVGHQGRRGPWSCEDLIPKCRGRQGLPGIQVPRKVYSRNYAG